MNVLQQATAMVMVTLCGTGTVMADLYVYPKNGQSAEQTDKDKYECYNWAKGDTGFDPMALPTTTTAKPGGKKKSGTAVMGGLGGAGVGALLGGKKGAKRARLPVV